MINKMIPDRASSKFAAKSRYTRASLALNNSTPKIRSANRTPIPTNTVLTPKTKINETLFRTHLSPSTIPIPLTPPSLPTHATAHIPSPTLPTTLAIICASPSAHTPYLPIGTRYFLTHASLNRPYRPWITAGASIATIRSSCSVSVALAGGARRARFGAGRGLAVVERRFVSTAGRVGTLLDVEKYDGVAIVDFGRARGSLRNISNAFCSLVEVNNDAAARDSDLASCPDSAERTEDGAVGTDDGDMMIPSAVENVLGADDEADDDSTLRSLCIGSTTPFVGVRCRNNGSSSSSHSPDSIDLLLPRPTSDSPRRCPGSPCTPSLLDVDVRRGRIGVRGPVTEPTCASAILAARGTCLSSSFSTGLRFVADARRTTNLSSSSLSSFSLNGLTCPRATGVPTSPSFVVASSLCARTYSSNDIVSLCDPVVSPSSLLWLWLRISLATLSALPPRGLASGVCGVGVGGPSLRPVCFFPSPTPALTHSARLTGLRLSCSTGGASRSSTSSIANSSNIENRQVASSSSLPGPAADEIEVLAALCWGVAGVDGRPSGLEAIADGL
ncbi:hypothetical protein BC938DRAFT_474202 [Jimgerdemannia flammicorona]|uniref:Uncharacterized protein n=1 Tax=Jimgerdemannia flammicorona TaxID=994334 RepID=A0A433Q2Q8_9FUNG|nr:hypothetical protein BC938DRAFT_474202 [Jimgerdemannia flammicorona]